MDYLNILEQVFISVKREKTHLRVKKVSGNSGQDRLLYCKTPLRLHSAPEFYYVLSGGFQNDRTTAYLLTIYFSSYLQNLDYQGASDRFLEYSFLEVRVCSADPLLFFFFFKFNS